jgi:hypothetical protein
MRDELRIHPPRPSRKLVPFGSEIWSTHQFRKSVVFRCLSLADIYAALEDAARVLKEKTKRRSRINLLARSRSHQRHRLRADFVESDDASALVFVFRLSSEGKNQKF